MKITRIEMSQEDVCDAIREHIRTAYSLSITGVSIEEIGDSPQGKIEVIVSCIYAEPKKGNEK